MFEYTMFSQLSSGNLDAILIILKLDGLCKWMSGIVNVGLNSLKLMSFAALKGSSITAAPPIFIPSASPSLQKG